jgi:hypothetical protein
MKLINTGAYKTDSDIFAIRDFFREFDLEFKISFYVNNRVIYELGHIICEDALGTHYFFASKIDNDFIRVDYYLECIK